MVTENIAESLPETKEVMADHGFLFSEGKKEKSEPAKTDQKIEDSETSDIDEDADEIVDDESVKDDNKGEKKKKEGGFQKKINKLTGRALTAEQERDFYKQEYLKSKSVQQEPPKQQTQVQTGKPKAEDFDSHEEWHEALTDWKIEQREIKAEEKKQLNAAQSEAQSKAKSLQTKIDDFVKTKTDYHDVINDVDDIQIQAGLMNLIQDSDDAALLSYELAKNRSELERINSLPPRQAAIELLKFEAKLSSSSEPKKEVKTTKTPSPITPIGSGTATVSKSLTDPNISFSEYEKIRTQQLKK